jgi:hypothetical protein
MGHQSRVTLTLTAGEAAVAAPPRVRLGQTILRSVTAVMILSGISHRRNLRYLFIHSAGDKRRTARNTLLTLVVK